MVRPPTLAVGEDRSASRLELFFDLAYVLVVMQLVSAFTEDLTWSGLLILLGLFAVIWLSWMGSPSTPTGSIPTTWSFGLPSSPRK